MRYTSMAQQPVTRFIKDAHPDSTSSVNSEDDKNIVSVTLMASDGEIICRLCGKKITSEARKIFFYGDKKEGQNFLLSHVNCFQCNLCKTPLNSTSYFLSNKKQFYCYRHYDHDGPNRHDNLFRELRNFRKNSVDKTANLSTGGKTYNQHYGKPLRNGLVPCTCSAISRHCASSGHWYECTNQNCTFSRCFLQSRDYKHFQVSEWQKESAACNTHCEEGGELAVEHCEEELYEACYHNQKHSNFYTVDERIGPIVLSLKHETLSRHNFYRILLRSSSHILEGLVPNKCFCLTDYDDKTVLDVVSRELDLTSELRSFNDHIPPTKLLLLDKVMLKSEFKVGVLFINQGQTKEEQFFTNTHHSTDFEEFLTFLGDKVRLKGFTGFSGGLDTENELTGEYSIYKECGEKYKMMFHVSTLLPMEEHDDQKLQRKRHIGNDIVCIVYLSPGAKFDASAIKSNFLHVYIILQPQIVHGELFFKVDVATRDHVENYGPALPQDKLFKKDSVFQNWLYAKIINGERASYHSPKFASMQERTRRQLLEELVHDQACKEVQPLKFGKNPFQRWLPLRHSFSRQSTTPTPALQRSLSFAADHLGHHISSPADQLRRDLKRQLASGISQYHDVLFLVGKERGGSVPAVKALLAVKSRVFNEMFFPGTCPSPARRRSSVLSRVSPHYLSQHFKSTKRISEFWKRNNQTQTQIQTPPINAKHTPTLPPRTTPSNNNQSPKTRIFDVRESLVAPSELHITDFHIDEFSALIEYVQTGSCVIHAHVLAGLASAAEQYEIHDLVDYCVRSCEELCNPRIAPFMLSSVVPFTLRYSVASKLEETILSYIEMNADEVFDNFNMASLSNHVFTLILTSNLRINESKKFQAIQEWHERISLYVNSDDVMDELRHALLAHVDFTKLNGTHDIESMNTVSDQEETDNWCLHI